MDRWALGSGLHQTQAASWRAGDVILPSVSNPLNIDSGNQVVIQKFFLYLNTSLLPEGKNAPETMEFKK